MKKIAFIGYGLRSEYMMRAFRNIGAEIEVSAVADPRIGQIRANTAEDPYFAHTRYYEDTEEMLAKEEPDGFFIGTRCSLHTPYACRVLERDRPLFLEKPVCVTDEQYDRLKRAAEGKESRVVVSFPLRLTAIAEEMRRIVAGGSIGRVVMVQAVNNVPYGSVYYHSWYRDPKETGGLFLQKTTHDIDYINYIMDDRPAAVYAQTRKLYFRGDRPAGLRCPECDERYTCRESSWYVEKILKEEVQGDCCAFAVDTGNEDTASAIFTTAGGVMINYSQCFLVKKGAARRGARFIGTDGAAEFDFNTGEIREDRYLTPQTVIHKYDFANGNHFGGDEALALDFVNVLNGKKAVSDLTAGLISAADCLAARRSAETGRPVDIRY
ncbi:MAG: Gfo/Idh/MocA family oxidoreductase [Clostridia bacterium]|nr:Gfo/Idh/MocA family oxidoreductase [Clostridia bacterium]